MASYMDMVTVLLVLFIILFAMSSVDQQKFEKLKNSLATGFGTIEVGDIDTATGIVVPPERVDEEGAEVETVLTELDELNAIKEMIHTRLVEKGLEKSVSFKIDERGLTVQLIGSETYFHPSSATLTSKARTILDVVAPALVKSAHEVSVEGHADYRGPSYPYPTDWELSAARATNVLRHLVEINGFESEKIGAVGYGSARPAATGSSANDLALNRRVDIVVLSKDPEKLRALLPADITTASNLQPKG